MGRVEAMLDQVPLHAQIIGETHDAGAADLLQHNVQHQWAAVAQGRGHGACRFGAGGFQSGHDGGDATQAEGRVIIYIKTGCSPR